MKKGIKEFLKDIIYYIVGGSIYAIAVTVFLSANKISPGGVTGVATILKYLFQLPIGATVFIINIPLFIIAFIKFGKGFIIKTVLATAITSGLLDISDAVLPKIELDLILAGVFGGTLLGLGISIIMLRGATTGGVEIVAKLFAIKYPFISMGRLMLFLDFVVVISAAVVYKNIQSALYSVITLYACSKIMDLVLYGADRGKVVYIISEKTQDIVYDILNEIGRGVTTIDIRGGYTGNRGSMIMCTLRINQVHEVCQVAKRHDKGAFIVICEAGEILGEGFKKNK